MRRQGEVELSVESLAQKIRRRVEANELVDLTDRQVEECARILSPVLTRPTDEEVGPLQFTA